MLTLQCAEAQLALRDTTRQKSIPIGSQMRVCTPPDNRSRKLYKGSCCMLLVRLPSVRHPAQIARRTLAFHRRRGVVHSSQHCRQQVVETGLQRRAVQTSHDPCQLPCRHESVKGTSLCAST